MILRSTIFCKGATERFALAACCHENQLTKRTMFFERKKALKRNVATRQPARDVCDLFARNYPQGQGMSGGSRLTFVTAYPCRTMILRKRCHINPCLPGERETAPSLGVRPVSVGRKREEKPETSNRTIELVGKATMDNTSKGALRCRHARTSQSRMTGWTQKGKVSRSIGHNADGRSLALRPGIKHHPNVAQNGCAEQSNPFDALQQWSRQPAASHNGRDGPRSQRLRESRRIC